ncbi:MAG: PAS domain-containing protein, partial [Thermoplasmata archaeon]
HMKDSENHYLREENVLFPYLEKHGIVEPPKVMWMDHDQIRGLKKEFYGIYDERENKDFHEFAKELDEISCALADTLANHFSKENNILFPASMQVIEDDEWPEITKEFNDIGYCCFTPQPEGVAVEETETTPEIGIEGAIEFETGALSAEQIDAVFRTLPVDLTFVDDHDEVKYYTEGGGGLFRRTKASIGRKVQNCHPEKSVHLVNKILDDFKSGESEVEEFWIDMKGRKIHIRYFAVRDRKGDYLGCLEVTQDITDIKTIEGEKRLM